MGLRKLQAARSRAELDEKDGKRYTLEEMSRMTGLAVNTLMKVYARETRVDKQTLKTCFQAFNLVLEPTDYTRERSETEEMNGRIAIDPQEFGCWSFQRVKFL